MNAAAPTPDGVETDAGGTRWRGGTRGSRALSVLLGLGLCALVCGSLLDWWRIPVLDAGDRVLGDLRLRSRALVPDDRIVIVDIDEKSLEAVGRWTWPRSVIARLTQRIVDEGGASVLAFDIVFAESDGPGDAQLARALRGRPVVLGYYFTSDENGRRFGQLPPPLLSSAGLDPAIARPLQWDGYGANLALIGEAARDSGFFNSRVDDDGLVRSVPVLVENEGALYGSFAAACLRIHLQADAVALDGRRLQFLRGGRAVARMPLTRDLTALVPFTGGGGPHAGRFRYIPAVDVLSPGFDRATLAGRIVLVGSSAQGLGDRRATPVHRSLPGVEVHATLLAGVLDGAISAPPPASGALMALVTATLGGAAAVFMPMLGVAALLFAAVAGCSAVLALGAWALNAQGWVLPLSATLFTLVAITVLNLVLSYASERRARRAVVELFGQYVSPELVARMSRRPQDYPIESQNKRLTILFADVRGFTRIAESMEPQALREYLNRVLTRLTEVVHRHHGTVDKYMGDAIMAFWGAPVNDPRQEDHAVAASIEMVRVVAELNEEFRWRGWPALAIGVGVNSGTVRVGDMGSQLRRTYTAIGDAVNLAARLEGMTKQLGQPVLVGEATARGVTGIALHSLGESPVPGRVEPVRVYCPTEVLLPMPLAAPAMQQQA